MLLNVIVKRASVTNGLCTIANVTYGKNHSDAQSSTSNIRTRSLVHLLTSTAAQGGKSRRRSDFDSKRGLRECQAHRVTAEQPRRASKLSVGSDSIVVGLRSSFL